MIKLRKTFNFGKVDWNHTGRKINPVEVTVELRNNNDGKPVFAASAVVYNQTKTDCWTAGQCLNHIHLNDDTFKFIKKMWQAYHLNDMHAGTPEQEKALESCTAKDYIERCEYLKSIGLYEVELDGKPYKYGHSWLYQEIPADDLNAIKALFND